MSFFQSSSAARPPADDVELANPPPDSISELSWCPVADYLAVSSWNGEVRIYEVAQDGKAQGKASYNHEAPALCVTWSKDGARIFSGGADRAARAFDVSTGQSTQVGRHDDSVRCVKYFESPQAGGVLATGSWDKTVKYWDLRSPNPIATLPLAGRCYALDIQYPLMVVGSSERQIEVVNLTAPTKVHEKLDSPLKWQTRTVSCFPSADGYAVGSIEGRVAIQWVEQKKKSDNYSFRCHRKEETKTRTLIYAVNDIKFHPVHGTFATAGSDGTISIWDKDARARTKNFPAAPGPIASMAFNKSGSILAYAVSYDWSKGHSGMTAGHVNKVMLHPCKDEEVARKRR